jgi:hypothetical protein
MWSRSTVDNSISLKAFYDYVPDDDHVGWNDLY